MHSNSPEKILIFSKKTTDYIEWKHIPAVQRMEVYTTPCRVINWISK